MKLAVISVTNNGALLAEKLSKRLNSHVTVFNKQGRSCSSAGHVYHSLSELITAIFNQYDGLIFIMATGIVVRTIAPLIKDKRVDPAVVVVDDQANYAISLLSGHLGGANDLTLRVASAIHAKPVITTATDIAGKPAADLLAVKLNLLIEPFSNLKHINAALVNEENVIFTVDTDLPDSNLYVEKAQEIGTALQPLDCLDTGDYDAAVVITDRLLAMDRPHLFLRPATLAVGIGCRRNTPADNILAAVEDALTLISRSIKSIAVIASSEVKRNEPGLLEIAQRLSIPIIFFTNTQLQDSINTHNLQLSSFVNQQIGVGNVCEAAALYASQTNKLLLTKTKYQQVTIAIAAVK